MSHAVATRHCTVGFTLIEVLVALAVFALTGAIAYKGLHSVSETKATLDREIRFWRDLGLVFDRMETDFLQMVPYVWSGEGETAVPPLRAVSNAENGFLIEFSRQDANRPPVRITYRCQAGRLEMEMIPAILDTKASGNPNVIQTHPLITSIERCEAAFLDSRNAWQSFWPTATSPVKPRAVRIQLGLPGHGQFERIYYLP